MHRQINHNFVSTSPSLNEKENSRCDVQAVIKKFEISVKGQTPKRD